MVAKRINVLWAILGAVGGMALGAWYMGSRIQSPAEMAARTAAPEASPILVPVESRVLSSDVVTRGTVRFGLPQPISIAPSTVKGAVGLISSLPRPNTNFGEGEVILSASGRPVFVLRGAAPAFRDMAPGTSGGDVRQLEEALARLGFDPGTVDGNYDQKTSAAVERMYKKAGWDPFAPTREQRAAVATLEREWSDGSRDQLAAEATRETALKAVAAARAIADQNTRQATLDSAARAGNSRQLADARSGKSLALETERARAAHSAIAAGADVATQVADRALIVLDPRQTETARAAAEAKLKVARAAQRKAKLEADWRYRPRRATPLWPTNGSRSRGSGEGGTPRRRAIRGFFLRLLVPLRIAIVPDLAESSAWSADGRELTFHLRRGIRWHDGRSSPPRMSNGTWNLLLGKSATKFRINPRRSWTWNLDQVTASGDDEAIFRLKQPQPAFVALLASGYSPVYPCHVPRRSYASTDRHRSLQIRLVQAEPIDPAREKPGLLEAGTAVPTASSGRSFLTARRRC